MVTVSSKKGTPSSRANAKRGASPKTPRKRQNARKRQQAQASRTPGRVTTTLQGAAKDGVTVILLSLGTFLLLAFFSHTMSDPSWFHTGPENTRVANWMGHVGALVSDSLYSLFGTAALWWPALCALGAWQLVRRRIASFTWDTTVLAVRMAGLTLVLLGTCLLEALFSNIQQLKDHSFDIVGQGLRSGLTAPLGQHGATLVGISLVLCGVPLLTGLSWLTLMDEIGKALFRGLRGVGRFVRDRLLMAKERYDERRDARLPVSDELDDDVAAEPSWLSRKLSHLANTLGIHRGEPELDAYRSEPTSAVAPEHNVKPVRYAPYERPYPGSMTDSVDDSEEDAPALTIRARRDEQDERDAAPVPSVSTVADSRIPWDEAEQSDAAVAEQAERHRQTLQSLREAEERKAKEEEEALRRAAVSAPTRVDEPHEHADAPLITPQQEEPAPRREVPIVRAPAPDEVDEKNSDDVDASTIDVAKPTPAPLAAVHPVPVEAVAAWPAIAATQVAVNEPVFIPTAPISASTQDAVDEPEAREAAVHEEQVHERQGSVDDRTAPAARSSAASDDEMPAFTPRFMVDMDDEGEAEHVPEAPAPASAFDATPLSAADEEDDGDYGDDEADDVYAVHEPVRPSSVSMPVQQPASVALHKPEPQYVKDEQDEDEYADDEPLDLPERPLTPLSPRDSDNVAPASTMPISALDDDEDELVEDDGPKLWTVEHLQQRDENQHVEIIGEMPGIQLLTPADEQQPSYSEEELQQMAELLEMRLKEYGVKAEVVNISPGPVITQFEIMPAAGVKGSKISSLSKDLARSLLVKSVRVIEVIYGKPTVGIEIPNPHRAMIRLREVLDSDIYRNARSPLTVALGHNIGGHSVVADLAKMPHVLVAGTTGSGKSVGVNAMLISILMKSRPEDVRMILIDPKMLELSVYDDIPHLLAPVVTDMKEAANALRWCVAEMERRYKLMSKMGVRNIAGFNDKLDQAHAAGAQVADPLWDADTHAPGAQPDTLKKLPYIVVVIDEFADMFMIVGKKVEELIARLAQKARAAGIHLVLATQRPSVDVVTGLIKANIPSRIAFQVSSRIDSRTILDQGGAEALLGHGDMLYLAVGESTPTRIHGAFVDDDEVHRVVEDWKRRGKPEYDEEILSGGVSADALTGLEAEGEGGDAEQDVLYDEAVKFVTQTRRVSISSVQRKFKIGYNRAARLVEAMEMAGVVSSMGSNGSREVLAPPPISD